MPTHKPTHSELIQVLDEGITLYDIILYALNYVKKERARHAAKQRAVRQKQREAKVSGTPPAHQAEDTTPAV